MRTIKFLNTLGISIITVALFACSSDNKDESPIEPIVSEITLDKDQATLIIDESPVILKILTGNGEYSAFALNSKLLNITIENNELILEGLQIGVTDILLSDRDMLVKKIPVKVLKTESIQVDDDSKKFNFINIQGNAQVFNLAITNGNGGYKVSTDNNKLLKVEIIENSVIKITTVEGNSGGEANLTISDLSGLEETIHITIESSSNPFTETFIASIKSETVNTSEFLFWSTLVNDYTFNINKNQVNSISISKDRGDGWWNSYTSKAIIDYPLDLTSGSTNNATIYFENYPTKNNNSSDKQKLDLFEIIQNDTESLRAIFKYSDSKNILRYGYIIYKK